MYRPEHFEIHELVPKRLYEEYQAMGKQDKLWLLFDDRMLLAIDIIRKAYGRIIINDWYWGGRYDESGWRYWFTTTGALLSQHKFGRAFDLKPVNVGVEEIRHRIINRKICCGLITRVEDRTNWLHIDCGLAAVSGEIQVIMP